MSFRIERFAVEGAVVLRVSGHVRMEHTSTIEELIASERDQIALDLTELTLVDRDAVRYLARCELAGVELRNCPPFLREWVTREQAR